MLHEADCLDVLAQMAPDGVDAVVCDPPYEIGFMANAWDSSGTAFRAETWAAVLRVMRPGAHLCAMGATRGWHRLAVAIEDAGFDIRDSLAWLYGNGFPKSLNGPWGGTALKPAWEPVVVARKPLDGTVAANFERHGTGGLNIDDARVPLNGDTVPEFERNWRRRPMPGFGDTVEWTSRVVGKRGGDERGAQPGKFSPEPGMNEQRRRRTGESNTPDMGRWPANVAHDGSEEVLGELPYTLPATGRQRHCSISIGGGSAYGGSSGPFVTTGHEDDGGSAARYFYCAKPSRGEKEAGLYGSPVERRNTHPTAKPIALFRWLIRLACPRGGLVLDPFAGSGTTAIAAALEGRRWIAVEREAEYAAIARARIEWWCREAARKPGRSVAEILGEAPKPRPPVEGQGGLFE